MRAVPERLRPFVPAVVAALLSLVLIAGGWWLLVPARPVAPERPTAPGIIAGSSMIGGPFRLIDHDGREVTEATFRGRYLLVFFGFANCPDVCPLTLDRFAQVLDLLGPDAERVQPLLITVDPERDTPEALKDYVTAVDPRILGLTGTPEQVKAAASAYKVYFAKAATGEQGYSVDHSAFEYLMGPDGRNLYVLRSEAESDKIAELIRSMVRQKRAELSCSKTIIALR
jgi:protein SCO1